MIEVRESIEQIETTTIVVGLFQGEKKDSIYYKVMNELLNGKYVPLLQQHQTWAKFGEVNVIPVYDSNVVEFIIIVGLGNGKNLSTLKYEKLGTQVGRELHRNGCDNVSVWWDTIYLGEAETKNESESLSSFIKGCDMGYKTRNHNVREVLRKSSNHTIYLYVHRTKVEFINNVIFQTEEFLWTLELMERLITTPPNILTSQEFLKEIEKFAFHNRFEIDVFRKNDLQSLGMGGILAYSKDVADSAYFIKIQYKGDSSNEGYISLIGVAVMNYIYQEPDKINKKESNVVAATTALGILANVARKNLNVNISLLLPIVDVDCNKLQNGDVVRLFNGKTVEVVGDCFLEEFLIADSITFGLMENTNMIVNFSALSNELDIALGSNITVAMSNHSIFNNNFADRTICFLPLDNKLLNTVKMSRVADYSISLEKKGRAIIRGNFIGEFVHNVPWIHFDLGGFDRGCSERTMNKIESVLGTVVNIIEDKVKLL